MKWNFETVDFQNSKDDFATIVLYQPHWELKDWIQKDGLYFLQNQGKIDSLINKALNISHNHTSSVLILPELSVPEESISTIEEWSKSNSTIVVAGSHYIKTEEGYINRTPIISNGSIHYSEKLIPSPLEKSPISGESLIPGKRIVVFKNSKIGNFIVLICADYLEDNLSSEILSKFDLDFLFVPAFHNNSPFYYNKMDFNCKSSESGLYIVYCNNFLQNSSDGGSAFFGNMDRNYYDKLKGRMTDGKPTTKLIELSKRNEYAVIKADLKHKRPFLGKTIHSGPNVEVIYPKKVNNIDNHFERHTEYYQRFSQEYIGRDDDVELVLNFLKDPYPKDHFLLLIGVGGIGKSHLLSECRARIDCADLIHRECNSNFNLKTLFNICKIPYPEELEEVGAIQQCFLDIFCNRDITLILDDFYEIVDKDVRNLLPKLVKTSKGKILLVSRVIPKELTLIGLHINSYEIPALHREEFKTFIQNYIQSEGKIVSITEQDVSKIYNKAQGYPLGGQLIVDLLEMEEKIDDILKDLPKFQAKRDPEGKDFSGRLLDNIFKKGSKEEINFLCEFSALYEASSIEVIKQLPSYDFNAFEALVKRRRFIQKEGDGSFHCHAMIKDFAYEKLSDKEKIHNTIGKYYENILYKSTNLNSEFLLKTINHYKQIGIKKLRSFGRKISEKYKISDVKFLLENNVKDTIRNYESLLIIYPEKVAYWNELGMAYRKNNQKQLAIEAFLKGLKVEPNNVRILNELGITYRENNQKQLAIEAFKKRIEIEPDDPRSYNELGITYRENNQKQLAIEAFKKRIEIEPDDPRSYNELGITYRENNQKQLAIEAFKKRIEIEPDDPRSYNELGITYRENNQKQLAIEAFKKRIEIEPDDPRSYNELGITYRENNQKQLAIEAFKKRIEIEPDDPRFYNELGITYRENNQKQLAIEAFKKRIEIEPDDPRFYNELGITYRENNQKQLAIETFLKGLKVEPHNVRILNELGITYRENNQFDDAIKISEKALAINPKNKPSLLNLLQIFLFFEPDKDRATTFYAKLNDMRPAHPSFRNQRKNYEVFIENLDRIWDLTIDEFKIYDRYCFAAIQYKAYHTILPLLFELHKKYPINLKIVSRLGKTLSNQVICRNEEGRKFLLKAIELFESNHNEKQLIGHIFFYFYNLLNNEEFELLEDEIKRFKNKIEHLPNYYRFLGNYYDQLDKPEKEIIEHFEKAIEISSSNDEKVRSVNTLLNYLINKSEHKYKIRIERLKDHLKQKSPAANMVKSN